MLLLFNNRKFFLKCKLPLLPSCKYVHPLQSSYLKGFKNVLYCFKSALDLITKQHHCGKN